MATESRNKQYRIVGQNLFITPNWNGMADRVAMSCGSGASINVLMRGVSIGGHTTNISSDSEGMLPRSWSMRAFNTRLAHPMQTNYLYARVEREGLNGMYIWSINYYEVDGTVANSETTAPGNADYYYIRIAKMDYVDNKLVLSELDYGTLGFDETTGEETEALPYSWTDLIALNADGFLVFLKTIYSLVVTSIVIAGKTINAVLTSFDTPSADEAERNDAVVTEGFLAKWGKRFLRRDKDDSTEHSLKAGNLIVGAGGYHKTEGFREGEFDGAGAAIWVTSDEAGHIETDFLAVRRAAFFRTLTIAEVEHMGGEVVLSPAACKVAKVETVQKGVAFRVYFEKSANGKTCYNEWKPGDQAYYQQWQNGLRTKFYWRLVTAVGEDGDYWTITLSGSDMATGSGSPSVNDEIVLLGHRYGGYRASAQIYSTIGEGAPSRRYYYGITSYSFPEPVELMEHTEKGAHWKVGGSEKNFIEYKGDLRINASSVEIVSESGTTNVGDALSDNFQIWQTDQTAPFSGNDFSTMVDYSYFDISSAWGEDGSLAEHVGDYLLTSDGVAYKFAVDPDYPSEPYWEICSDQYLLAAMKEAKKATTFIAGFRSSDGFASLFSAAIDENGKIIKEGTAGTYVQARKDENGTQYITGFKIDTDVFICNAKNMKVDEEGNLECQNAKIRGFIYRDEIIITPNNYSQYLLDRREWYFNMGTQALPAGALVLDVRKTGPNFVVQGNFGSDPNAFVNIVLPSLHPTFQINAEQLSVVRSMAGETMHITNNTSLLMRVYGVQDSNPFTIGLVGAPISIGNQRVVKCERTFATTSFNPTTGGYRAGDEIVHWTIEGTDKAVNYHEPITDTNG